MSELIYAIEFAKHVNLPRVCEFLMNLGYPLRQLHEKETCYRFEYKTIKELKELGFRHFISKPLTDDINFIIAKRSNPTQAPPAAVAVTH